ncbi:MAG: SDR family NAD(P)-dependent oxidoreductase [Pseudomonadota bacterium]
MKRNHQLKWHPAHTSGTDFQGKQVAVIGGTGGIGRALSLYLAARGARVLVVGQTFRDAGVAGIEFMQADLSLMRQAHSVAKRLPAESLDLVIFTAGIFAGPVRQETAEGIERDMAVSFLNRMVILNAVAPRLGTQRVDPSGKPRVFVVGYPGSGQIGSPDDLNAEKSYKAMAAHMNTVAGNEMLVLDAARQYPGIAIFGLNPGLIKTNIRDNLLGGGSLKSRVIEGLIGLMTPTADQYAQRMGPLLASPDIDVHSGALFNNKAQAILPTPGLNREYTERFMAASWGLVARAGISALAA